MGLMAHLAMVLKGVDRIIRGGSVDKDGRRAKKFAKQARPKKKKGVKNKNKSTQSESGQATFARSL